VIQPSERSERGPYGVGLRTLTLDDPHTPGRSFETDLWYPAAEPRNGPQASHPFGQRHEAVEDLAARGETCPLAVFSHGNAGMRRQSTFLTTHLASWGIAVVAPDHAGNTFHEMARITDEAERISVHRSARENRPRDALAAVDAALNGAFGPIALESAHVAAIGHSFGGWTATKLPGIDPRVRTVCALAPASEAFIGRSAYRPGELPLPEAVATLVIAGIDDVLVDLDLSVRPLVARLGPNTAAVGLIDADHFHFCDGIELLHAQHESNPRPGQPRATKAYAQSLPGHRAQRAIRALTTSFCEASFSSRTTPSTGPTPDGLATLDAAVRWL
jgi:pimeloyl-ACP methyl ester carboxylesterase